MQEKRISPIGIQPTPRDGRYILRALLFSPPVLFTSAYLSAFAASFNLGHWPKPTDAYYQNGILNFILCTITMLALHIFTISLVLTIVLGPVHILTKFTGSAHWLQSSRNGSTLAYATLLHLLIVGIAFWDPFNVFRWIFGFVDS